MQRFLIGDTVSYGIHGVCLVEDIKTMDFGAAGEMYYVLKPIYDNKSTVYVPCEKELHEEFAYVLNITKEQVVPCILGSLELKKDKMRAESITQLFSFIILTISAHNGIINGNFLLHKASKIP